MYLTQRAALKLLREQTGMSVTACREAISKLPKKLDGCRQKVSKTHINRAIADLSTPPSLADLGLKPLSATRKARTEWPSVIR